LRRAKAIEAERIRRARSGRGDKILSAIGYGTRKVGRAAFSAIERATRPVPPSKSKKYKRKRKSQGLFDIGF